MTYYLFNVDPLYKKINSNYDIFHFFKNLDNTIKSEINYNNLTKRFNKKEVNNSIINTFANNKFYNYKDNYHTYNNKYRLESFALKVGNNLLILRTNHLNKELFKSLSDYSFFVCDFQNQDYFWINEFCC